MIPSIEVERRQSYLIIAVQFSYISVNVIHRTRIYCKMYQRKRCISTIRSLQVDNSNIPFQAARRSFLSFLTSKADNLYFLFIQTQWKLHSAITNGKKVAKLYLIHFCFYILNKTGSFRFSIKYGFLNNLLLYLWIFIYNMKLNLSIWA